MNSSSSSAQRPQELSGHHRLTVRRLMRARRDDVFGMWTSARKMAEWMKPEQCTGSRVTLDVRVGGEFQIDMLGKKGEVWEHRGTYLEVKPPERLVFTWTSLGTNGLPSIVTIELLERGADTEVMLTHEGLPTEKSASDHSVGWMEILQVLEKLVAAAVFLTEVLDKGPHTTR